MATYISDTFTDTNGTAINAHTPNIGGAWGGTTFQINNNTVAIPGNFVSMSATINATAMGSADFDVSMDILAVTATTGNGDWLGVMGRGVPGAGNFYAAYYNGSYGGTAQQVRLSKFVGNGETILGTYSLAYVQGVTHNLKFRLQGTTLSVLIDGTTQISLTDSTYTTGTTVGIISATSFNMALAGDNFLATDVGGGGGGVTLTPTAIACVTTVPAPTITGIGGGSPVTFDAVGPSSSGQVALSSPSSITWNHTCSGTNGLLVVIVSEDDTASDATKTLTCTYNGVSMVSDGRQESGASDQGFVQMFHLVNPSTGTHAVVATLTATCHGFSGGSVSFNNVDQTTPVQNFVTNNVGGAGATSVGVTVSSAANNMVVAGAGYGSSVAGNPTSTQTQRWTCGLGGGSGCNSSTGATAAGASSVAFTFTGAGADWWGAVGIDVRAASGGSGDAIITPTAIACVTTVPAPTITGLTANGYVQSKAQTGSGATTTALTLTSAITAGNLLVADVCFHSAGQTVSLSDGHNTWVPIGSQQEGVSTFLNVAIQQFYAANVAAGTYAITVTRSGATGFMDLAVLEVAGRATTSPLDAHAYNNPTGNTSATSASITPSVNGCYVQSFIGNDITSVSGVNAPFVERENANFDTNSVDDYLQTTAASVAATWTMPAGNSHQITAIAAFLPASSGSVNITPTTIACVTTVPAPTLTVQLGVTLTPATITAVASVPAIQGSESAVLTPDTITAVTTVPVLTPTIGGGPATVTGTVSLAATAGMNVGAFVTELPSVPLAATAGLNVSALVTELPSVPLTATTTLTVTGTRTQFATVPLTATAGLTVTAFDTIFASVPLTATSGLNVTATDTIFATVPMTALAGMTVTGGVAGTNAVFLVASSGLTVTSLVTELASVPLAATAGLTVSPSLTVLAAVPMSATTGLIVTGTPVGTVGVIMATATTLLVGVSVTELASVLLAASTSLTVTPRLTVFGQVNMAASGLLTVGVQQGFVAAVPLVGTTTMTVVGTAFPYQIVQGIVSMTATTGLVVIVSIKSLLGPPPVIVPSGQGGLNPRDPYGGWTAIDETVYDIPLPQQSPYTRSP